MLNDLKHINSSEQFEKLLIEEFLHYAEKNGNEKTLENFVRYLVEMDIIPEKTRQRFTILKSFRKLYKENGYHKTNTVNDLAVIFECSEKTIWNILKHHPFDYE